MAVSRMSSLPSVLTYREIRLTPVHRGRRCEDRIPRSRATRRSRAVLLLDRGLIIVWHRLADGGEACSSWGKNRSPAAAPARSSSTRRTCRAPSTRRSASRSVVHQSRNWSSRRRANPRAAYHVHGFADRGARRDAAPRIPPHRPAVEDHPRGAAAGAAAGEPRPDPQPRARDQESAGRHPRRGATPRARTRPTAAHRIHAGHHRRGRSATARSSTGC